MSALADALEVAEATATPAASPGATADLLSDWEDVLVLLVDPESSGVTDRDRKRRLLSFLLDRAGLDEDAFWKRSRGQRGRLFLSHYSRLSRDIPGLEVTSFDLDKLAKERFRQDPLTLGSAWHFGFWRSYFSHAAITHPANDGLREEFSTGWDICRRLPSVLYRKRDGGAELETLPAVNLDMPMIVGPIPISDGHRLECAYLRAIERANPDKGQKTRTLVVVEADVLLAHRNAYQPHASWILPRLEARHLPAAEESVSGTLGALLEHARVIELVWNDDAPTYLERLRKRYPACLLSVYLENGPGFWSALEAAASTDGVAMVQVNSGSEKSYRFLPRVDDFLKERSLRARVQLVNTGGATDTQASAATVYESVLLGANGGAMTHVAALALLPELVDSYHGADAETILATLAELDPQELTLKAENTLTCWQHSILDFLSCMGIDDIKKTSGNTMAITLTEDWLREVDELATPAFATSNIALNRRRVLAEPVPRTVRDRYRVSALIHERTEDLPAVLAAGLMADESSSWHLMNTNRNLTADFLEVIYRMAAGQLPSSADDFFLEGDMGLGSIDDIGVALSRESVEWSLERLHRNPQLLDYISMAVPRGFHRPGAVPARARVDLLGPESSVPVVRFEADAEGGFDVAVAEVRDLDSGRPFKLKARDEAENSTSELELLANDHGAHGRSVVRASADGSTFLKRDPRGGYRLVGIGIRRPVWQGPVGHASISLGAASEDFLKARIEGNAGLAFTSSGEGGPIRLESDEVMQWESLQAASGHFGLRGADLRQVRDVEIKINQGAKPGKGGRLSGAKVTEQVSRARNIPVGTNALSPDPKHDIYSIEDMPAEVWLWLSYHNHCGIKITGSNYTQFVAAGMWSNFVVDYLLIDSGIGGSGNYHADSSHVGWPDIFRTILHTHHALVNEKVDLEGSGELRSLRDNNGAPFGAEGGTRLFASGGLRGELDILKLLIAGADGVVEASIGKAAAFGCNQCGNCHLDCPRGGITTKPELTLQNDRALMAQRFRNWTAVNLIKLAVLIDALNRESGALDADGQVAQPSELFDDIRQLRGRVDLLKMPRHAPRTDEGVAAQEEHDSCRVGSLAVSAPVTIHAIWEAARVSHNGGNNRGGGIDFAGFAPRAVREKTCLIFNTIGPDRAQTIGEMLEHLRESCRFFDTEGEELDFDGVQSGAERFQLPAREECAGEEGWRKAGLREAPGNYYLFFCELRSEVIEDYAKRLVASPDWLQRKTKYGDYSDEELLAFCAEPTSPFVIDVREEYFTALAHLLDSRFYRTHDTAGAPAGKYASKRRGYLVSMGEDLGAIKLSGWTHQIPIYFDCDRFWAGYPGAAALGGIEIELRGKRLRTQALYAHIWGMHHRYPTNTPAIDAEGRGNPAGAHPFKSYNVLLMHNGEQVAVDSTAPFLCEYGHVHAHPSMGAGAELYEGDSFYERKALTDTEYAAYLIDFTRRVLGLSTEEASQIVSPITGIDLEAMDKERREKLALLMQNYVPLTPTGPYKFTIVESLLRDGVRVVGFRENMDIKFLRPHEIISHRDLSAGGPEAVANGSEAKIADSMLRVLHQQGVLKDAASDLRFNMRQGGKPGLEEHGGVFEAFVVPGRLDLSLVNRFGEEVPVKRAGFRVDLSVPVDQVDRLAELSWMQLVDDLVEAACREARAPSGAESSRLFAPEDPLPVRASALLQVTLERIRSLSFHDYRYLVERALPAAAATGDAERALALRVLTELRKRLCFSDLGGKALSSLEYLTDGGRDQAGGPEGGIYRILDGVPHIADGWGDGHYVRISAATRDDLVGPEDPGRDVLVIDLAGFESEAFTRLSCTRFLSDVVRHGWRQIIGYDARGGPRYIGTNTGDEHGVAVSDVCIELYGRETGDFVGALNEGGSIYVYGQAQSHVGFKADSGHLFVLQDALNTCMYAAHGATFSTWDSGSRFAVAGQNAVYLQDGQTLAQGFKSIHFGSPNEYAFEYLMAGGENSLHVVLGLKKPDAGGELSLRPKPYAGKFLMSGAAAGLVYLFDPERRMDPAQHGGNVSVEIEVDEWNEKVAPFILAESNRRGAPIRIEGESFSIRLDGEWRTWDFREAFVKLVPEVAVAAAAERGRTSAPAVVV